MMLQEVALIVPAFFPDFGTVSSNYLRKRSLLSSSVYENSLKYPEKELFEANQTQYSSSIQPSQMTYLSDSYLTAAALKQLSGC
jgi:hypothetical protein